MLKIILLLIFITSVPILTYSQNTDTSKVTIISGKVKDDKGKPVNGANVVIQGTIDGATTDDKGNFEFETDKSGKKILIITALDQADKFFEIEIVPGQNQSLNISLSKEVKTDEIVVTASTFTSGANSQVTLTPMEIVRIPGADADLYRAITTFPGSYQVDEGSRITVRGGDPNEVLTILDQASLYNPFVFDGAYNSSSFSTVNPWGLKGINFSSGGFSAKFGNVLSAVLDLQSYDIPRANGMFALLGLANASLAGSFTNTENTFGGTFSLSKLFVKPFLELNGDKTDFSAIPNSNGFGGTAAYKIGKSSLIKYYLNYSDDKVGVRNTSPSFSGYFETKSQSLFSNIKFSTTPTSVSLLNISLSYSSYFAGIKYGVLDNNSKNFYGKLRTDFSLPLSTVIDFSTGVEYEYNAYFLDGSFPKYFYNLKPEADVFRLNMDNNTGRIGGYAEARFKISRDFNAIGGLRSDYFTISKKTIVDPRLSLVYRLTEYSYLKAATGIYHQNPELENFLQSGMVDLLPENAKHYILGYEYNREGDYIFRVESYYKDYSNLVSANQYGNFIANEGKGYAKGVDVFLKVRLKPKFNGWISYAYTDSKRKNLLTGGKYLSATYDITHTVSVVANYNITNLFMLGASYKISTGRPYTPVTGAIYNAGQNAYIPISAETNSGRFPTYQRVDINSQYIFTAFNKFVILILALNNLFNQDNLYGYTYNFDYSQKIKVRSSNERTLYLGIGLQL